MKKSILLLTLVLCCIPMVLGSIVTNTNQSAIYIRYLARGASTDIDAVYYNPAGTTKLSDGFHIAIHNQSLFQEKTVINAFPYLNDDTYIGEVKVPFFPTFFAVYKVSNLAISFGFGPNAGGGSADYATGLPSFEIPISAVPLMLSMPPYNLPITGYDADIAFKGTSIYYGFQLNVSYAVMDFISVGAGMRYISAINTYEGHIKNIMLNYGGMMVPGTTFDPQLGNKEVDAKQTGSGFTPILSLHLNPIDELNIGVRYELNTKLELENETTVDDTGLFPNGGLTNNDIPAIFSVGAEYEVIPSLRVAATYNLFFDKNANWDGAELLVNNNTYDLGFGVELDVTENILISGGYLLTKMDVMDAYQTDMTHEISSQSIGFGGRISLGRLDVDLGGLFLMYDKDVKNILSYASMGLGSYQQSYERTTWGFTVGLGYHLTK
jgi:long-chain fatty acid transport protein